MKNYKIILISFVLIFFLIGAVSAADDNSNNIVSDPVPVIEVIPDLNLDETVNQDPVTPGVSAEVTTKDIYVNSTGDDSNQGTKESPYATVSKAFSDVNASDDATINIGEGIFLLDQSLNINFNHELYGGNLKFIGAGADKTFLDGQSAFCFATIGTNSNVTIENITFINCKAINGGVINNKGNLTVDNCIFKDSYCTNVRGGAIISAGSQNAEFVNGEIKYVNVIATTKILNSQFISTYINSKRTNSQGGAIYATMSNIYLENNTFVNNSLSTGGGRGVAVYVETSSCSLLNNKFINLTGSNDASIYLTITDDIATVVGNEFINCSNPSNTYSIVNLWQGTFKFENNKFINSTNSVGNIYTGSAAKMSVLNFAMDYKIYNVSNKDVSKGFKLNKINITDDMGNIVSKSPIFVNLNNDENSISKSVRLTNGECTFTFSSVPENGIYNLTLSTGDVITDVLGIVNISLNNDPIELWVAPNGLDANNGTLDSPFATIQHAIDVGFEKSFTVTIHLLKGTYTKDGNVELTIANQGSLQILGEKYNETIIDGESTSWFLKVSTTNVNVTNVSFVNGYGNLKDLISGGKSLFLDNCIIDNNDLSNNNDYYILVNTLFDRLVYTNNGGRISVPGKITITESYFANNVYKYSQSNGIINTAGATFKDCKFINNTNAQNGGAIEGYFTSINNYYENNSPINGGTGGAVYITGDSTFINDTFINNHAEQGGAFYVYIYDEYLSQSPKVSFDNCKFINNTASKGGVGYLNIGQFTGCSFINNTADYGGALYVVPYIKVDETNNENPISPIDPIPVIPVLGAMIPIDIITPVDPVNPVEEGTINSLELNDCTFENNVARINGNDAYLELPMDWWLDDDSEIAYPIPLTITFNSQNVTSLVDDLTATVYGPSGAVIGAKYLTFVLNGTKIGSPEVVNSVVTFNYAGFEDGDYILNGTVEYPNNKNVVTPGLISVKLENIIDHIDLWVSNEGSDENGNGSESNPFKSISKAIKEAVKNCRDITINIAEGTYAGDLNTGLTISSLNNITLVGKGIDKTIIDGENATVFAKITEGNNKVTLKDLTIQNMMPANVEEFMAGNKNLNNLARKLNALDCPITVDEGANLYLDGVRITSCRGGSAIIRNNGNLNVENSLFNNNGISSNGIIYGGTVSINNTEISSNVAEWGVLYEIQSLVVNNSLFKNNFNLGYFALIGSSNYGYNEETIIENTVISNDGDNSSLSVIGYNGTYSLNPAFCLAGCVLANNISMINSYGSPLSEYNLLASSGSFLSAFGLIYGSGGRTVSVSNSTFINLTNLWSVNTYGTVLFSFDGCVFDGITMIAKSLTPGEGSQYNITNSVFIDSDLVIDRQNYVSREDPNCTFENNYWGSNDKPAIIFVNTGQDRATSFEPATWIALYSEDGKTVIKNVTDGENSTAYLGNAPIRTDYADNKGALDYAVVFGPVGYLLTTDDENNIVLNATEEIYPFEAADPMNYRTPTVIVINKVNGSSAVFGALYDMVGNPIADAAIVYYVNGAEYNTTSDADGSFVVFGGDGDLNITFPGDNNYFPTDNSIALEKIAPVKTGTAIDVNVDGNLNINAVLKDADGNGIENAEILYKIGTQNATVTTGANGTFSIKGEENAKVEIFYAGNDLLLPASTAVTLSEVAPTRVASEINASDFTCYAVDTAAGEKGAMFKVTLKDASGNLITDASVKFALNGEIYNATTDENGSAALQVNIDTANTYTCAVSYLGDVKHEASFTAVKVVVNKKKTTLTAKAKTFKVKTKTKKYTATLKTVKGSSADGKTYLKAGKKVTLKVNGKTYTAKTNSKGQVTFKITKLTKKGKFSAVIKFAGDKTYKAVTKTVKITVK